MICHCFGHTLDITALGQRVGQTARLMVGVPDYDTYVQHMQNTHPTQTPMTRPAFFANRQAARFAGGGMRCC